MENLDGKIILTTEELDNILKETYKSGVEDSQERRNNKITGYRKKLHKEEFYKELKHVCGSFYFNFYNKFKITERQYLFRFIYLCTFMDYDNYLANNRRLYKEDDLQNLLKLSRAEYFNTKKFLIENSLIKITKYKNILVNKKYCKKGDLKMEKNIEVVRIFDKAIKELYEKSAPKEHRRLALLFEILPYINFNHNILCKNPLEDDFMKIEPLSLKELCVLIGCDPKRPSVLKKRLFNLTVDGDIVIGIFDKIIGSCIYVNPKVYYKGELDISEFEYLIRMFKLGNKKYSQ